MVALILFMPAIVVDDQGILESLRTSQRYVKGNFWRASAIISVAGVLLIVVSAGVGAVTGVVTAMVSSDPTLIVLAVQGTSLIVNIIALPMVAAVMLELYFDLKLRKEGTDLETRLASVA